jgi:hypothetical protein
MTLTQFVILVTAVPFVVAFAIVLAPVNIFVRASLVGLGVTALAVLPLSVSPESDLAGLFWVGVSLWGLGGSFAGVAAGALARLLLRRRREREKHLLTQR